MPGTTIGTIGEGNQGKVLVRTDGCGGVELSVAVAPGWWTGPTLTVEQARTVIDTLTAEIVSAAKGG